MAAALASSAMRTVAHACRLISRPTRWAICTIKGGLQEGGGGMSRSEGGAGGGDLSILVRGEEIHEGKKNSLLR
jgi:hypothetical protein